MMRYVRVMNTNVPPIPRDDDPMDYLRADLARGDRALAGIAPVLVKMLAGPSAVLISDRTLAQLRGMIGALASQLLLALRDVAMQEKDSQNQYDELVFKLSSNTQLLSHCYALSVEGQLAHHFESTLHIDQTASPLLQNSLNADGEIAKLAAGAFSAQSRFIQGQARMSLDLRDLPADLFRIAISSATAMLSSDAGIDLDVTSASLRESYDEASSRLALLTRLVTGLPGGASAALDLEQAGLSLFASALSSLTGLPRELAVLACTEGQHTRLGFMLKACAIPQAKIDILMSQIHPKVVLPSSFAELDSGAAAVVINSTPQSGSGVDS